MFFVTRAQFNSYVAPYSKNPLYQVYKHFWCYIKDLKRLKYRLQIEIARAYTTVDTANLSKGLTGTIFPIHSLIFSYQ